MLGTALGLTLKLRAWEVLPIFKVYYPLPVKVSENWIIVPYSPPLFLI